MVHPVVLVEQLLTRLCVGVEHILFFLDVSLELGYPGFVHLNLYLADRISDLKPVSLLAHVADELNIAHRDHVVEV